MTKMKMLMSLMTLACMMTWLIGTTSDASSATPGSVNDPLVTKSYVDQKDGELKTEIDARLVALESSTDSSDTSGDTEPTIGGDLDMDAIYAYIDQKLAEGGSGGSPEGLLFTVVEAKKGQKIICGASAEIILRAGNAAVVAGANGDGLADLTSGSDLRGGDAVPAQHHLLVSRDDGRGIMITNEDPNATAYILVKGAYTVE